MLAERDQGYKDYLSLYANFFDFNFLFEYKDYNTPYLYNVFSAPPMGFREPISILSSRNLHTVDFSNEFGYMLELSRVFNNSLNLVLSYSYALHHLENKSDPSVFKYVTTAKMQDLEEYWPYKQYHIEFSNTTKDEKLFYKIEKRLPCSRIGLSMADFVDLPKKGKGNIQNAFKRSLASSSSSSLSTKTAPVLTSTTTNWNNIDKAVLATLPEDIRKEILSEYSNNKKKMKNRINNDKQSKKNRS